MRHVYDHRNDRHPVAAQGINGDYPEVAFTLVSQTVEGLMGFRPDAPRARVSTRSHLPRDIDWVRADNIPVGDGFFGLRHDGTHRSTLTNATSKAYTWQARFPGDHRTVRADGRPHEFQRRALHGSVHTCVNVRIPPGGTATVEIDRE
ncbi:CBM6 domain-containing protein OS=Streptomyces rimosus subsp. rimosus (strain ATCC / DSM 40260/ JCM 4667 / NRRL 2234) OX=1265868 GN=SRIM_003805 PE=4 SV=1 [Streptomyces rimosus subsp. rimosus]